MKGYQTLRFLNRKQNPEPTQPQMNLNVYSENGPDFRESGDVDSVMSRGSDEKRIVNHLHKYYCESNSDTNNTDTKTNSYITEHVIETDDKNIVVTENKMDSIPIQPRQLVKQTPTATKTDGPTCKICDNKSGRDDNYVILSCNHTFHIYCLAETHFNDVYKFHVIDSDYFGTRKCLVCEKSMQTEELMFLHSKFLNSTKDRIENHNHKIETLDAKLKEIKEELRVCYEYKHKLEHEREKSKQIVATLMTMI
jgi:hypothetical protein